MGTKEWQFKLMFYDDVDAALRGSARRWDCLIGLDTTNAWKVK